MAYAVRADLELAIGVETVTQIFDDDSSGSGDADPITQLLLEASSYVDAHLEQLYEIPIADSNGNVPNLVKFLTLDVAAGLAFNRHPEFVRVTAKDRLDRAMKLLERLRKGDIGLDSELLPVPRNEISTARSGDATSPTYNPLIFSYGKMGDF